MKKSRIMLLSEVTFKNVFSFNGLWGFFLGIIF